MKAGRSPQPLRISLQSRLPADTVNTGLGTEPCRAPVGNKMQARTPNHAHRAEVSLVAPSGRVGGLRATG